MRICLSDSLIMGLPVKQEGVHWLLRLPVGCAVIFGSSFRRVLLKRASSKILSIGGIFWSIILVLFPSRRGLVARGTRIRT
jgi:hypothetical protein